MVRIRDGLEIPDAELTFTTARSSGPGGQNVNKVESRVTLLFDLEGQGFAAKVFDIPSDTPGLVGCAILPLGKSVASLADGQSLFWMGIAGLGCGPLF